MTDWLEDLKKQREADAEKFRTCDDDLCMICHAYGADKRSLFISMFYQLKEVAPEFIELFAVEEFKDRGYYLRLCKSCRGAVMSALREAFNLRRRLRGTLLDHDGYRMDEEYIDGYNIPVRVDGVVVMMDQYQYEEYKRKHQDKE